MKTALSSAALVAALLLPGAAASQGVLQTQTVAPGTIVASCFRGPWREVIWDRPQPVFVDSLVVAGYDYPTAHALAERICRDISSVNNPRALRETTARVVRSYPPRR